MWNRSKKINTRNAFDAVEDLSFDTNWHEILTATADRRPNQYLMENQKSRIEGFLKTQPRTCRMSRIVNIHKLYYEISLKICKIDER